MFGKCAVVVACSIAALYNIYSMLVVLYHAGVLVLYQKYIMQEWLILYQKHGMQEWLVLYLSYSMQEWLRSIACRSGSFSIQEWLILYQSYSMQEWLFLYHKYI